MFSIAQLAEGAPQCFEALGKLTQAPSSLSMVFVHHYVPPGSAAAAAVKLFQLCPTLCDPIDGSPPGSSVPGILWARILEWVAISFSNA